MGFLNYTLDDFELHVGTLVLDKRCIELTISPGISEPEDWISWKGSFKVRRTREAIAAGLTDSDFSDRATWGKGQQPVQLWLNGDKVATLRIEDYYWDTATQTGEGKLIQLLDLMAMERASEKVDEIRLGAGTNITELIRALLLKAGKIEDTQLIDNSQIDLSGAPDLMSEDVISFPLVSESPVKDAQELAGKFYCWLWVDKDEVIRIKQRPETQGNPLLYRSDRQCESEPNPANRNFSAAHVIRTGSKQFTAANYEYENRDENEPETEEERDRQDDEQAAEEFTDDQGRPRLVVTQSQKNAYELFPKRYSRLTTVEIVYERKLVFYFYFDEQDPFPVDTFGWAGQFGLGVESEILGKVQDEIYRIYLEREEVIRIADAARRDPVPAIGEEAIATLVLHQQLRNQVFPGDRPEDDLVYESAEIETDREKIELTPKGKRLNTSYQKYLLTVANREFVTNGTTRQLERKTTETDPETGDPTEQEPEPEKEGPLLKSTFSIQTGSFRSETVLRPTGYSEYLSRNDIADIGTITSQAQLDEFTRRTAYREIQRRDSRLYQMPLPAEYLATGLAPFPIAHIGDGAFIVEQPAIDINSTRASLTFQGDRIGSLQYPIPRLPDPKPIPWTTALFIAVPRNVFGIVGEAIAPVQLIARNGTAPYSFSGTMPTGLALSSSGLITGTPAARLNTSAVVTLTDDDGAIATTTVWFVAVAPQPPILEYGEELLFEFGLAIGFGAAQSKPGGIFSSLLAIGFDFFVEDGDTTGGGGGY